MLDDEELELIMSMGLKVRCSFIIRKLFVMRARTVVGLLYLSFVKSWKLQFPREFYCYALLPLS